ncbi:hypothetical protein CBS101457_003644 [Exobasidium rhododendri]|nr:hypothetical protein CBS101457_003644 [Exobasidium rhododendri]
MAASTGTGSNAAVAPQSLPSPTTSSYRRWEPLSKIEYGFAVSPFLPDLASLTSTEEEVEAEDQADSSARLATIQTHLIGLEVGDEVYIFEQLGHKEVCWVRGYVVSTTRVPTSATTASSLSDYSAFPSTIAAGASLQEEPQVYVGIFPRANVHIKEHLDDAEMRLTEVFAKAKELGIIGATAPPPLKQLVASNHMETLAEEDENTASQPASPTIATPARAGVVLSQVSTSFGPNKITFDSSRQSFILQDSQSNEERPPPPLPSLKCGDETKSGGIEPLVDEIACALREWSALMYVYLSRRDYALFHAVREHIEVLHIARRQLLAQTLSEEEVEKLRRECVARLVKGNVQQGLDVIVRHPGRGGLVDVDFTGKESDPESWISGIRLYALQTALAYVDQEKGQDSSDLGASNAFGIVNQITSSSGMFGASVTNTNSSAGKGVTRQVAQLKPRRSSAFSGVDEANNIKYFHVYLDVRAFVASPCMPGETAELYFSLYNKAESRFLTEEYCVILNHQGVPAREMQGKLGKMRALFTDLSSNDMQDLNLVCRIIRNGAMRLSNSDTQRPPAGGQGNEGVGELSNDTSFTESMNLSRTPGFQSSRMTTDRCFRRPFGCAVVELGQDHRFQSDIVSSSTLREHVMPIFVPVNEAAFSTLHQDIIASRVKEFEKSPRADLLAISVKVFHGEKRTIVRENPSLLQDAPLTARLGFPDVVFPGDTRNEAYIKLWSGEFFPQGNKMPGGNTPRNIQISVEVRNKDGTVLDNVISRGAGEALVTQFDSTVFYHQNAPTWGELLKLQLPKEVMENCHLFFSFRHRSSKEEKMGAVGGPQQQQGGGETTVVNQPFAHAFLPLFEANDAFIPDGSHTLLLWRTSRPTQHISPELYFSLPSTIPMGKSLNEAVPTSLSNIIQPLRDVMTLRTFLVSARYTQNEVLLKLLHWEKLLTQNVEELKAILIQFSFVGEVEIVKFLRDIFDALFGIVVNPRNGSGELDDLVFNSLVTMLGIVQDRRFNNFRATLDVYIDQHYHSQTVHTRLMASMSKLLADPTRIETSKDLRAAIKVWPYLFKFIVKSRENQRGIKDPIGALGGAVSDHLGTSFKNDLDQLLRYINRLMATSKPSSIIGTQTLALQNFAGILPEVSRIFPLEEMAQIETAFVDSIFVTKGRMAIWKLLHIIHVTHDALFDDHASRSQILPSIVRWVRPHLGRYEESSHTAPGDLDNVKDSARIAWVEAARLGVTIFAVILDKLQVNLLSGKKNNVSPQRLRQEQDNVDYLLSMMPRLLETYKELDSVETRVVLERHRSPSTISSAVPVIFPSSYPFPLIARKPVGQMTPSNRARSSRRHLRKEQPPFLNCGLGELAVVITVLVMLSPRRHLAGFLDEQLDVEGPEKLSKFLYDFFEVTTSILHNEAYPDTWLNINILAHQMILKMADPLASLMVRDFIPSADKSDTFDTQLWKAGLNMLLALLSSEQLVIEKFKPQRRRAVWRLAGDVRGEGAQIFAKLWNSIGWPTDRPASDRPNSEIPDPGKLNTGGFQVQFVPSLVEPVLELCLSHHDELRTCAVRVLATMITSEWHLNGDFSVIEAEIIDKLDVLFIADTQGDEISRAFFIGQLRSLFDSPHVDPKLQEQVHICLSSVNRFLDLLLSVRSLPLEEGFEDDRVSGTLKLLGFLRQANRVTAFSTHVLRLVNLHLENHNYVEAGLTLKLHADLHTWELNEFVEPVPDLDLPRQSHFARKETIYMLILDYLSKGQAWEISIDICRELAKEYEYRSMDYQQLSNILQLQASLFQKIGSEERTFPNYFRVAYYGSQWPVSLQGKNFIYRGLNWEKFSNFCERLHQKHPKATLIKTTKEVSDEVRFSTTSMFIQIMAVTPEPDRTKDVFVNPESPPIIRAYYEHNTTDLFSFTRPLPSGGSSSSMTGGSSSSNSNSNSRKPNKSSATTASATHPAAGVDGQSDAIATLWVEKTYLKVEDSFPTVLRRSEIADINVIKISPIENAILDVENKVKELESLHVKFASLSKVMGKMANLNTNRLSMALNGAVDAPINGGIPTYKRAFFSTIYISNHPDEEALLFKLRTAVENQVSIIFLCLILHNTLCPVEMKPFHETLIGFFKQNFQEEIKRLTLNMHLLTEPVDGRRGADLQDNATLNNDAHSVSTSARGRKLSHINVLNGHDVATEGKTAISPLQRHIAYLSQQDQPLKGSPTTYDTTNSGRVVAMTGGGAGEGPQTVPPISGNFAASVFGIGGTPTLNMINNSKMVNSNSVDSTTSTTSESIFKGFSASVVGAGDAQSTMSKGQGSLLSKVTESGKGRASKIFGRRK